MWNTNANANAKISKVFHVEHLEGQFFRNGERSMWNTWRNSCLHLWKGWLLCSSNSLWLLWNVFVGSLH